MIHDETARGIGARNRQRVFSRSRRPALLDTPRHAL